MRYAPFLSKIGHNIAQSAFWINNCKPANDILPVMSNYLISICRSDLATNQTIHDPGTKLKVRAIDLLTSGFRPKKGEVSYFVTSGGETYAFETSGYKNQR